MKKILTAVAMLACLSAMAYDSFTVLPVTVAGATTNSTIFTSAISPSTAVKLRGVTLTSGAITPQNVGIWITTTNSAAGASTHNYVFTFSQDGNTNTLATGTGSTFSLTVTANGTNVNRQYFQVAGTNFIGTKGFALTAIPNTNASTTHTCLGVVVQGSGE